VNRTPEKPVDAAARIPPAPRARLLRQAAGYLFAAACLVWVFHDVELGVLLQSMRSLKVSWVLVAVLFDVASYACQGWRWALLLRPLGRITTLRSTQAIYVGLFLNEILPLRIGELARIFVVSRWMKEPVSRIVPSIAVERLFDGIWLAVGMGLTAIFIPLPRDLLDAADVLGIVILLATALFVFVVFRPRKNVEPPDRAPEGWAAKFFKSVVAGISDIGMSRAFWSALSVSFVFLFLQAVAFWMVMRAAGLPLSFWHGFVVLLIVHLGTAIPNAPANVGSYQFFVVVGLLLFGVEKQVAAGFSVVVFVILTIPLWAIGWVALRRAGLRVANLREEARSWKREADL